MCIFQRQSVQKNMLMMKRLICHTDNKWRIVWTEFHIVYFIKDNILEDGSQSILFGIMDGHGG